MPPALSPPIKLVGHNICYNPPIAEACGSQQVILVGTGTVIEEEPQEEPQGYLEGRLLSLSGANY